MFSSPRPIGHELLTVPGREQPPGQDPGAADPVRVGGQHRGAALQVNIFCYHSDIFHQRTTASIPHVSQPPVSLYWTRDGRVFTAKDRPGISLESEKVMMMMMMTMMMMMMMVMMTTATMMTVKVMMMMMMMMMQIPLRSTHKSCRGAED